MGITSNYGSAPTYVKIGTITPNGTASDYAFINLPQNYTDLVLVANIRGSKAATTCSLLAYGGTGDDNTSLLQSNENSVVAIVGDGSSVTNARTTSGTGLQLYAAPAASTTSGIFKQYIINFMGYSNGTGYKSVITRTNGNTETALIIGSVRTTSPLKTVGVATYGDGNIASGSTLTLYGIKAAIVPKATGGDLIRTDGTYWYHIFNNSGVFSPRQTISTDILTVAGGGSGGSRAGGGGGAGGLVYTASQSLTNSFGYTVTVGAGGGRVVSMPSTRGNNGSNTTVTGGSLSLTAAVGGGGGGVYPGTAGLTATTGGSGGGGGSILGSTSGAGAAGTAGQGNSGGNGASAAYHGGGGGGAGAAGSNGDTGQGGNGGVGSSTYSSWGVGQNVSGTYYLAGGGGGSGGSSSGGSGGGGAGSQSNSSATSATANTGGGGGGARNASDTYAVTSGNGGSGIVVMRYAV